MDQTAYRSGKNFDPIKIKFVTFLKMGMSKEEAYKKANGITDNASYGYRAAVWAESAECEAIDEEISMNMQESILSLKDHMDKLAELRDDAHDNGKFAAAINAEVARGKAAGLYTIKHEHTVNNEDQLSEMEIRARLARLSRGQDASYGNLLESKGTVDAEFSEIGRRETSERTPEEGRGEEESF